MDHNLAYSCVGYGAIRVLREQRPAGALPLPAKYILEQPDPVQFCIDALGSDHPDWIEGIDAETRRAIHERLRDEARLARASRN
ncbi:MAG: hypothetical protein LDL25_06095 [Hyphomicrobiales bacterium]|jgi:hypothetical protein|uniref:hypothetical protein n=1 Tax=Rhabdaerophilum calidifontis TaxID=2604328 RepID=UPI0012392C51|nr:hypothetical protein [Rhabdaerophilum calidifontis]MCA1952240.1 hypothetical protein [Hyphomicrobiales bacterium]MCA1999342.1 hypothetical protein [Hyphomicrobiales bacterium]